MTAFRVQVDAEEFARVMTNALAFFPARSQVKFAELRFSPERIDAIGTDTYTIGTDWCEAHSWQSAERVTEPVRVQLDRDGWREIEPQARKDRGNTAVIEYRPGDCLTFHPGGEKAETAVAQDQTGKPWDSEVAGLTGAEFWDEARALLDRLDAEPEPMPERITFDPDYFARFAKVKVSKKVEADKVLDFSCQGPDAPMLAKVGPTFVGAIMPIDRGAYIDNQPEEAGDALW